MAGEPRSRGAVALRVGVVLLLAAVCVALAFTLLNRNRTADSAADRAAQTFSPPAVAVAGPALVSVISDETSGPEPGSAAAQRAPRPWMSFVTSAVSVRIAPFIVTGSGYTATGPSKANGGSTYVSRAAQISTTTRIVVFVGGGADRSAAALSEIKACTRALASAKDAAPRAKLVVVGPASASSLPPEDVLALRNVLKGAAGVAGARWIDPIARGWLQKTEYWTASGTLSAAGQRELGRRMTTVLEAELGG